MTEPNTNRDAAGEGSATCKAGALGGPRKSASTPLSDKVSCPIESDANGVWRLPGAGVFNYTDGESHERYLREVLQKASDLSSDSYELEGYIRDWVTEYHLSRKRSQLLRGFTFVRGAKVLEVGCGCGAITRYLGETFVDVVAIEGSLPRATLARMRTRGMPNVSILNAPFQDIPFATRFDIIFCIGVFEYSKLFVKGNDPHDAVLRCFKDILAPGGAVVVAIENQFGLKYFASSAEDHNGIMFDGLEGYPRYDTHRTFGHGELKERLATHFAHTKFYFPYPDYKLTSAVLSEDAFGRANLGELVGNFAPRDYSKARAPAFNQRLVLMELARNRMLPLFANSFLVVAGNAGGSTMAFGQLGIMFSDRRRREYQTITRLEERGDGSLWMKKRRMAPGADDGDPFKLEGYEEPWLESDSIQMQVLKRVKRRGISLRALLEPCEPWMRKIRSVAFKKEGGWVVEGRYVDSIWPNSFVKDGECVFIDNEWKWKGDIRVNVLLARSAHYLLSEIRGMRDGDSQLSRGGTWSLVQRIGRELGVELSSGDRREFLKLEDEFVGTVTGRKRKRAGRVVGKLKRALGRVWARNTPR